MNWRKLSIGVKGYRFQYHDELCQPQAEVDFEKLVAFLLDLGVMPIQEGFADLRSSGLWTPAGTKLMLSPCTADAVLSVTTSEDSDGILALALEWRSDWNKRGTNDLPPYWMKLSAPIDLKPTEIDEEKKPNVVGEVDNEKDENNPFRELTRLQYRERMLQRMRKYSKRLNGTVAPITWVLKMFAYDDFQQVLTSLLQPKILTTNDRSL